MGTPSGDAAPVLPSVVPGAMPTSSATPDQLGGRAGEAASRSGPTHTSTGTVDVRDLVEQRHVGRRRGRPRRWLLICRTRARRPGRSERRSTAVDDDVDQHRVEQAADLSTATKPPSGSRVRRVAGAGVEPGLAAAGGPARRWCRRTAAATAAGVDGPARATRPAGRGPSAASATMTSPRRRVGSVRLTFLRREKGGSCAVLRSIPRGHRGREGRRGQNHRQRRARPGGGAAPGSPP